MSILIAIGSALLAVTKAVGALSLAVQGLKVIANAIVSLAKSLGLIKADMKTEDLGDKAIQSGLKPEDFDTYEEYTKAVEKFETDPERSKQISEEEKLNKGIEIATNLMAEKYGDGVGQFIAKTAVENREFFNENVMAKVGEIVKDDSSFIDNAVNVITGSLKDGEVFDNVVTILGDIAKTTGTPYPSTFPRIPGGSLIN